MQDKGENITPMEIYSLAFFANKLYPEIGILCMTESEINIPELTIIDIPKMKWS